MKVLKFGGSSVAGPDQIRQVRDIVRSGLSNDRLVVVVSAFGGVTDALLQSATLAASGDATYINVVNALMERHLTAVKELMPLTAQSSLLSFVMQQFHELEDICQGLFLLRELSAKSKDRVSAYGEQISSRIISEYLGSEGMENEWADARQLILTDASYGRASVLFDETRNRVSNYMNDHPKELYLVPGFIASDAQGNTTTLGRGGSDYTAAILGAALNASVVEIWTDVSGMMTADPRMVANARPIRHISYSEAMELSHFGAKVIYPPTIQPLMNSRIPVGIRNTFFPEDEGTLLSADDSGNGSLIRGISSMGKMALLSLEGSGMVGVPGFSKKLFDALATSGINVILITQASSEHSICVGVGEADAEEARMAVDKAFSYEIEKGLLLPLDVEESLSIIALVGDHMKNHPGISGRMFGALGRNGVNVRAIAQGSSERNISAVIASADTRKALNVLHEEFFETTYKEVNLFIAGTGNVGGKLLDQISRQVAFLQEHLRIQFRIAGLANSRKMKFSAVGIDLEHWKEELENGEPMDLDVFVATMKSRNLRNSVFVDVTASDSVASVYEKILPSSISIVACNKIACSSPFANYKKLKDLARDFNTSFHFETNVGASLPIIGTLNDLLRSGDRVHRIIAVLSGTLNFVFNHYDGTRSFAEVVRQAQSEGYTEPDPRLDLGGVDVMRKIMILAREAGQPLEMSAIENLSFMPESCMTGTVEDFYREMENHEPHFRTLLSEAKATNTKLKFVAAYEDGKASVGLRHIGPEHDFYHLYGKDNIVLFYSDRYVHQPLVIKGAGAGAEVTASGVFADIIRAAGLHGL
jgi:aspartokinase/homoserine dehydrogenase 1